MRGAMGLIFQQLKEVLDKKRKGSKNVARVERSRKVTGAVKKMCCKPDNGIAFAEMSKSWDSDSPRESSAKVR